MSGGTILIAGGYGHVGSRVAADLAPDFPGRVVVAGRDAEQAKAAAAALGHGVRGRALDVTVPQSVTAALDDASVVLSCIDQSERGLLHAAIQRGLGYTDITPHLTELGRGPAFDEIDHAAKLFGARVVLGTGLVPGISSVMVRSLADTLGGADAIETSLLLSAKDATGPGSFEYFLREVTMSFDVHTDGVDRRARAFSAPRVVVFPPPIGMRRAYLFPFSDQVLYPRTLGARTALSRLAIEPAPLSSFLSFLVRTGAVGVLSKDRVRRALAGARRGRTASRDSRFALRVDVRRGDVASTGSLSGRVQAVATAAGAAAVVRSLLDREVDQPGGWMPEQVIDPARFFARLARHGFTVELPAATPA